MKGQFEPYVIKVSMAGARLETETVLFACIQKLLDKTGAAG